MCLVDIMNVKVLVCMYVQNAIRYKFKSTTSKLLF